jgi:hypothetical protein
MKVGLKTDHHDITEILLKVEHHQTKQQTNLTLIIDNTHMIRYTIWALTYT